MTAPMLAKPTPPLVEWAHIPEAMRQAKRWVGWRYESRLDIETGELKWTKVPYQVRCPTYKASSTNSKTWGTCAQAEAAYAHGDVEGVGFVLGNGWAGVDLDHCCDETTGALEAWAQQEVESFASYSEWSPSGTGVHILFHGEVPDGGHKRGGTEAYSAGRFLTVTGLQLAETPATVEARQDALDAFCARHFPKAASKEGGAELSVRRLPSTPSDLDDEALIAKAQGARNGEKFSRLWAGDAGDFPSRSEAVASLLCGLAFWTQKDVARMGRLFRRSGLMSDKWEEKRGASTWGDCEIASAIEYTTDMYEPVLRALPSASHAATESDGGDGTATDSPTHDDPDGPERSGSDTKPTQKAKRAPSQSALIVALVDDLGIELFHAPDKTPFARMPVNGHHETWTLKGAGFRRFIARQFYVNHRAVPSDQAIKEARNILEGMAVFEGQAHKVWLRTAEHDGAVYLDLCDDAWRAVKITASGWRIDPAPPVRFRRAKGMLALPEPVTGGTVDTLREYVNVSDDKWPLLKGWMVGTLRSSGPFSLLLLRGRQGSAKTTTARMVRSLVDPNESPVRAVPRDARDLAVAANNAWSLAYDNISSLQPWLSDAFCRLSTGGGFSTRMLWEDDEEVIFHALRPVMVTGIEEVITESDLLDRTIELPLPAIKKRRTEEDLWRAFDIAAPGILGALLTQVAGAMRCLSHVDKANLPRMADFAQWAAAAELGAGSTAGAFLKAYEEQRKDADTVAREASPIAATLQKWWETWAKDHPEKAWEGTSADLLEHLNVTADDATKHHKDWPKKPRALTGRVERVAPNLLSIGIQIERPEGRSERGKLWVIDKVGRDRQDRQDRQEGATNQEYNSAGAPDDSPPLPDGPDDSGDLAPSDRQEVIAQLFRDSDGPDGPDGRADAFSGGGTIPALSNGHVNGANGRHPAVPVAPDSLEPVGEVGDWTD